MISNVSVFLKLNIAFLIILTFALVELNFFYSNNKVSLITQYVFNSKSDRHYNKYVIFECNNKQLCGGLVDRFKGIMNAYAWALFTNRTLIISITKPCYFENLMVPNQIKWNINFNTLVKNDKLPWWYSLHEIKRIDDSKFPDEIKNTNIFNYQKDKDVISIHSNIGWISAYASNK